MDDGFLADCEQAGREHAWAATSVYEFTGSGWLRPGTWCEFCWTSGPPQPALIVGDERRLVENVEPADRYL